jgi:tetratricopeptide (TPR) repeat protein
MRGLRRDLGEATPRPDAAAGGRSANSTIARSSSGKREVGSSAAVGLELPPGEWAPIPLPAGFADLEEKLRAARNAGDEDAEDKLLLNATNKLIDAGHFAIAEHLVYRMVELAGNDDRDVPFAYGQLGLAQYRLGKSAEAIASYERSEAVYGKLYDRMMALPKSEQVLEYRSHLARLRGITLMRIGNVHKSADAYQLAKIHYEKAKELCEAHDRHDELVTLLLNYGGLESQHGNYPQAIALLQQGLAVTQLSNDQEAELRVNLGNAFSRSGDNILAVEQHQQAYELVTVDSDYRPCPEGRSKPLPPAFPPPRNS